jgi:hypothetical protein
MAALVTVIASQETFTLYKTGFIFCKYFWSIDVETMYNSESEAIQAMRSYFHGKNLKFTFG